MNITVIGATGNTGFSFVKQALEKGHHVTALARTPEKLSIQHPNLQIVKGNVLNTVDVRKVVKGQDAIFIALGTGELPKKSNIREKGTQAVVDALQAIAETPQIVILSSLGTGKSIHQIPLRIRWFVKLVLLFVLADHKQQEAIIMSSTLPYTILRPTSLHDTSPVGRLTATTTDEMLVIRPAIARDDLTCFAIESIESQQFVNQTVALTHWG